MQPHYAVVSMLIGSIVGQLGIDETWMNIGGSD